MTSDETNVTASWKRPWTLNEIISSSNNWSLAGDSGVCELLKQFSSDLITEVTQVNYNVSEVQIESKQLYVFMENVSNDLCMLANDQFMENLVEDVDNVAQTKTSAEVIPISKEDKAMNTIPLVTRALKMGVQVLENQFEVIDVTRMGSISQNFDENEMESKTGTDLPSNEAIYQPKDPYESRHLPHLIGTSDFIEDDTLGIGYIDDIDEAQGITPDSFSVKSVENEPKDYLTSSSSEDESSVGGKLKQEKESGSNIFDKNSLTKSQDLFDEDSDEYQSKNNSRPVTEEIAQTKPESLSDQLNKQMKQRLSVSVKPSSNIHVDVSLPSPSSKKPADSHIAAVRSSPPGSGLWSSDEDGIFPSKSSTNIKESLVPKKRSESSIPAPEPLPRTLHEVKPSQTKSSVPTKAAVREDTDSDEDLFNFAKKSIPGKRATNPIVATMPTAKKKMSTFSDSDDDFFGDSKNAPKSMQNGSQAPTATSKPQSTVVSKPPISNLNTKTLTTSSKLFDFSSDEDDGNLFSIPAQKKTTVPAALVKPTDSSSSHEVTDKKTESSISVKSATKSSKVLTDAEEEDDFDNMFKPLVSKTVTSEKASSKVNLPSRTVTKIEPKKVIADEEDSDELFNDTPLKTKAAQRKEPNTDNNPHQENNVKTPIKVDIKADQKKSDLEEDSDELFKETPQKLKAAQRKLSKTDNITQKENNVKMKVDIKVDQKNSDVEEDSDELFKETPQKTKAARRKLPKMNNNIPQENNLNTPVKSDIKVDQKKSDLGEDSDDLFKDTSQNTKAAQNKEPKTNLKTSVKSDLKVEQNKLDSNDDDDQHFLNPLEKINGDSKINNNKLPENNVNEEQKSTLAKDDIDDLFGESPKKINAAQNENIKVNNSTVNQNESQEISRQKVMSDEYDSDDLFAGNALKIKGAQSKETKVNNNLDTMKPVSEDIFTDSRSKPKPVQNRDSTIDKRQSVLVDPLQGLSQVSEQDSPQEVGSDNIFGGIKKSSPSALISVDVEVKGSHNRFREVTANESRLEKIESRQDVAISAEDGTNTFREVSVHRPPVSVVKEDGDNGPSQRPSRGPGRPPPGGVSMFPGGASVMAALRGRVSVHKASQEEETEPRPSVPRAQAPPLGEDAEIDLEAPPSAVNQLTHLTKKKARVTTRRKPGAIKVDKPIEDPVHKEAVAEIAQPLPAPASPHQVSPKPLPASPPLEPVAATVTPSQESIDIFADVPAPEKKTKTKKKDSSRSKKTADVDVNEIEDIFAVPGGKKTASKRGKTRAVPAGSGDPLGAT